MQTEGKRKKIPTILIVIGGGVLLAFIGCCLVVALYKPSPETIARMTTTAEAKATIAAQPSPTPTNTPLPADTPLPTNTPGPTDTPAPTATSTPRPQSPTCAEIFTKKAQLTDAQWKNFKDEELPGLWIVEWEGEIYEVGKKSILWGGGYPVTIKITSNCHLIYGETDEEKALKFNRGQEMVITGQINSLSEFLGLFSFSLKAGTVEIK